MVDHNKDEVRIQDARTALGGVDARLTPQREAVLKALLSHPLGHQSAEEVLHAARRFRPDLGLATVYRALELFAKLGVVRRLDTANDQARFEYNADQQHYHHHVICLRCGRIAEFNEDLLENIEERAARRTGYQVVDHCLQLYGYCPDCSAARQEETEPEV